MTPLGRALLDRWRFVLVKAGTRFLVPYTEARRRRILDEGGYGPDFPDFLERFLQTLVEGDWPPGSYFPGGWYRAMQGRGQSADEAGITWEQVQPFYLDEMRVEADGRWFVGPKEVTGNVLRHFLHNLHFDTTLGCYYVSYPLEAHHELRYVHPLSPPLRVVRVDLTRPNPHVELNDDSEWSLRPETLRLDAAERLYCAVREEGVVALFDDAARFQLLQRLEQRDGAWVLHLPVGEWTLQLDAPRPYAGDVVPDP